MLLGLFSGLLIVAQAWLLASLLHALIIEHTPREQLIPSFIWLAAAFALRALLSWLRERVGFRCGQVIRQRMRQQVLDKLQQLGPAWIQGKPAGSWASIIVEQIEDMQDYYSRYLPQMYLAVFIPLLILIAVFPINWAAGIILLATAPLIPLFMVLVGMGAADANRRNFVALARLSGNFLDRLRGLDTLRLFDRAQAETAQIAKSSEDFRSRTMEVLRMAFLSSGVLEFFASISIAVVAVYFGFSYLGELNFGSYGLGVTLFSGFLVLILAPEFFQPLRDLGTFYHAKAQAVGAAEALETFLSAEGEQMGNGTRQLAADQPLTLQANALEILSPNGVLLAGPLSFTLQPQQRVALVGLSGAGKSSLLNLLLGFLPYRGSLTVNGVELRDLSAENWRQQLSWVGQNPHLPAQTLRANPAFDAETAITELGVGEALVSFLDEKGRPNVVERAMVIAPESKMGMLGAEGLNSAINKSPLYGRYEDMIDRESAYEKLSSGGFATVGTPQQGQQPQAQQQQQQAGGGLMDGLNELLFGSTGPRGGKRDGIVQTAAKSMARDLGRQILRGVLGSITGGRKK